VVQNSLLAAGIRAIKRKCRSRTEFGVHALFDTLTGRLQETL
jgi:hypothetical protein